MMQKLLVIGGAGLIGSKFINLYNDKFDIFAPTAEELDILDFPKTKKAIGESPANLVINFAAFTNVDKAEEENGKKEGIVYRLNALAVKNLVEICEAVNKHLVYFSTDYVFDGTKNQSPYTEEDLPHPISWYGETKYLGEKYLTESGADFTIIRTAMPFSAKYELKQDIARFFLETLKSGKEITAIDDQFVTPVLVDDIANALAVIIKSKTKGIFHLVCTDSTTPFDFARMIADKFNLDGSLVKPTKFADYNKLRNAKRLKYSWLSTKKFEEQFGGGILHTVEESVQIFKQQVE